MRAIVTRLALAALLVASAVPAQTPREWSLGPTGRGGAQWSERQGRLIYRGGATVGWALVKDAPLRDGFVQVRFRSIGGREDRAGGVIWRWRDPGNYYVARAHALAGNVLAFKVVNGRRDDLAPDGGATDFEIRGVKSRDWRTLRVDFAGAEFRVSLDGRRLFTVRDGALAGPGAVGCWSKADSVTEFERFEYGAT